MRHHEEKVSTKTMKITERAEHKFKQAEELLKRAMVPAAVEQAEDLSDVLDNPLTTMYAMKHPELVERAHNESVINESLDEMKASMS